VIPVCAIPVAVISIPVYMISVGISVGVLVMGDNPARLIPDDRRAVRPGGNGNAVGIAGRCHGQNADDDGQGEARNQHPATSSMRRTATSPN
jgi:hypothetical protein